MVMEHKLETSRLHLRPCSLADVTPLHALWTNKSVRHFLFDERIIPTDEARSFVEASLDSFARQFGG